MGFKIGFDFPHYLFFLSIPLLSLCMCLLLFLHFVLVYLGKKIRKKNSGLNVKLDRRGGPGYISVSGNCPISL